MNIEEIDYRSCPNGEYMGPGVERWVMDGIIPGDFLVGIIANDLRQAVYHADNNNRAAIVEWVFWFRENVPVDCHGSKVKMTEWATQGGWKGMNDADPTSS